MADEEKKVIYKVEIDEGAAIADTNKLTKTIESLTKANTDLRNERKKVNLETVEGQKRIKEINAELDKNNKLIKDNSSALEKQRLNIGAYKDGILDATKSINIHGVSVGDLSTKMASLAGPAGIATIAVGVFSALSAAYARSTIGAKDLEFAQNELGAAVGITTNRFARLFSSGKDGEGFLTSITEALIGSVAGLDVLVLSRLSAANQELLEDLGRTELEIRDKINERLEENSELNADIAAEATSYNDKIFKSNQIIDNLRKNESELVQVKRDQLHIIEQQLKIDSENESLQTAVLEKQREISNIERDTEKRVQNTLKLKDNINTAEDKRLATLQKQNQAQAEADKRSASGSGSDTTGLDGLQAFADGRAEIQKGQVNTEKTFADISLGITKAANQGKLDSEKFFNTEYQDILKERADAEMAFNQFKISSLQNLAGALQTAFGKNKVLALGALALEKGAAIGQVVANTGIANAKAVGFSPLTFGQPWVAINSIAAGLNIASILRSFTQATSEVSAAAGGGTFLTRGPTKLIVGDNPGGVERVTVEPLSGRGKTRIVGPNLIAMAGGGSLTTQPSAPFQTSFIAGQLNAERLMNGMIDQIRKIPRVAVVIEDVNRLNEQRAEITESARLR